MLEIPHRSKKHLEDMVGSPLEYIEELQGDWVTNVKDYDNNGKEFTAVVVVKDGKIF